MRYWAGWLWSWPVQARDWLAYRLRPYDPIADARRWFWQRRSECGSEWAARNPAAVAAIVAAIERRELGDR